MSIMEDKILAAMRKGWQTVVVVILIKKYHSSELVLLFGCIMWCLGCIYN